MSTSSRWLLLALAAVVACDQNAPTSPSGPPVPPQNGNTITITAAGANPQTVQIELGERVVFVNTDSVAHEMSSDQHPDHLECPVINQVGFLAPGQTKETGNFVVAEICAFHDHLNASNATLRGTIVVSQ